MTREELPPKGKEDIQRQPDTVTHQKSGTHLEPGRRWKLNPEAVN